MDSQNRSYLQAELYDLARIRRLTFSNAALRGVRSILRKSEAVPPERLEEAEKAMRTLLQAAAIASTRRTMGPQIRSGDVYGEDEIAECWSSGAHIRSADVYAGLKSICPLWPFC